MNACDMIIDNRPSPRKAAMPLFGSAIAFISLLAVGAIGLAGMMAAGMM